LAAAERGLGYAILKNGDPTRGRAHISDALRIMARIARRDPRNRDFASLDAKLRKDLSDFDLAQPGSSARPDAPADGGEKCRMGEATAPAPTAAGRS
jgi:hypothetical protein